MTADPAPAGSGGFGRVLSFCRFRYAFAKFVHRTYAVFNVGVRKFILDPFIFCAIRTIRVHFIADIDMQANARVKRSLHNFVGI